MRRRFLKLGALLYECESVAEKETCMVNSALRVRDANSLNDEN